MVNHSSHTTTYTYTSVCIRRESVFSDIHIGLIISTTTNYTDIDSTAVNSIYLGFTSYDPPFRLFFYVC